METLEVFDDGQGPKLYAGGSFKLPGSTSVVYLARWNGAAWEQVGGGLGSSPNVWALQSYNDGSGAKLYVGGRFNAAGPALQSTKNLAAWDGSSWTTFPEGPEHGVTSMAVHDLGAGPRLIVGGEFIRVGTNVTGSVVAYGPGGWEVLDPQLRDQNTNTTRVRSIDAPPFSGLYAFGRAFSIVRWNGSAWVAFPSDVPPPSARVGDLGAFDDGEGMALYATYGPDFTQGNPWVAGFYKYQGSAWKPVNANDIKPMRTRAAMAYDEARSRCVLFGGMTDPAIPTSDLNDTWVFDGRAWERQDIPSPGARSSAGMAYDSARSRVILVGGERAGSALSDVWTYDGVSWQQLAPFPGPARRSFAMCYDARRDRVVAFGGHGAGPADLGDTWEFDGTTWTQIETATAPAARRDVAMAFDPARGVIVLYGGRTGAGSHLFDLWEYNGAWSQRTYNTRDYPGQRGSHSAYYYPLRQGVIFQGDPASQTALRPSAWDGREWHLASGMNTAGTAAAYHPLLGTAVFVGGMFNETPFPETELRPATFGYDDFEHVGETCQWGSTLVAVNVGSGARLCVGGNFAQIGRGKRPASNIALWGAPCTAPTITLPPANASPTRADVPAVFNFAAVGTGPLIYQWRLDGVPLLNVSGIFSGSQTPTLTVNGWNLDRAGPYDCVIGYPGGTLASSSAVVNVPRVPASGPLDLLTGVTGIGFIRQDEFNEYFGSASGPSSTGDIAYIAIARHDQDNFDIGLLARQSGPDGLFAAPRLLLQERASAPGLEEGATIDTLSGCVAGPNGAVAALARATSNGVQSRVIYHFLPGQDPTIVLREGTPISVPGFPTGTTVRLLQPPAVDHSGRVVVRVNVQTLSSEVFGSIWEWTANAGLRLLYVEETSESPNGLAIQVDGAGNVLIVDSLADSTPTLYIASRAQLSLITSPASPPPMIPAGYAVSQATGLLAEGGDVYLSITCTATGQPSRAIIYRYSNGSLQPLFDDGRPWGAPATSPSLKPLSVAAANAEGDMVLFGSVPTCGTSCPKNAVYVRTSEGTFVQAFVNDVTPAPATMPAGTMLRRGSRAIIGTRGEVLMEVTEVPAIGATMASVVGFSKEAGLFPVCTNTTPFRLDGDLDLTAESTSLVPGAARVALIGTDARFGLVIGGNDGSKTFAIASLSEVVEFAFNCPVFVSPPTVTGARYGGRAVLEANAGGAPTITYQWFYEGIPLQNSGRVSGATTARLEIFPLALEDAGVYLASATNGCGTTLGPPRTMVVPCPADLDDGSDEGRPDLAVTIDDLLFMLVHFEQGTIGADLDDGSGTGTRDDAVTIDDLLFFLARFEAGC